MDKDPGYRLRYTWKVEPGRWYPSDLSDEDIQGLADHVVLISLVEHDDGSVSQMVLPYNGTRCEPMSIGHEFVVWAAWAQRLLDSDELPPTLRALCKLVDMVQKQIEEGEG